jgi:hypothetical protein
VKLLVIRVGGRHGGSVWKRLERRQAPQGKPGDWFSIASGAVPRFNDGMKKAKSSTHRTGQSQKLEQMDYRAWKARCAALLERQGILSGVMRERQWRHLLTTGVTAEQAVERAQVHYNSIRPPFVRMRRR